MANIYFNLSSEIKMPALGLGTFQDKQFEQAMDVALEAGYRHIDTAWLYENEEVIGKVLKKWFDSGKLKREDVFITTKLPPVGVHPDRVEMFMKKSLANLQLDYVDLYLIHCPLGLKYKEGSTRPLFNADGTVVTEAKTDHEAVWKKMEEQVDAGRTKTIGISNYNISQIEQYLKFARIKPVNLQVELHVYLQQRELVDFCHKNGITVTAYSPLGTPGFKKFTQNIGGETKSLPEIIVNPVLEKIGKKYSKTASQVALRFLVQRGVAPIPRSVNSSRIQANLNVFDFQLDEDDIKEIGALDLGECGRGTTFKIPYKGVDKHPDYPFKNN